MSFLGLKWIFYTLCAATAAERISLLCRPEQNLGKRRKQKMKKLMFVAAFAAGFAAFGDGIESANVVGYTTDTIKATKFNMVSVPFEGTDGDGFKINNCLRGVNLVGTDDAATADQIQIWDAATGAYDNWFYYDVGDEYTGWWDVISGASLFEEVYTTGLPIGKPFWYKAVGSGTFDLTFTK
jgi:hypothetical protein